MTRDLSNEHTAGARASTSDVVVTGDPDAWQLVCKASSADQGWMKSTKRMAVDGGWLYQVTTEHRANGCVTACAEAVTFVPGPADDRVQRIADILADHLTQHEQAKG